MWRQTECVHKHRRPARLLHHQRRVPLLNRAKAIGLFGSLVATPLALSCRERAWPVAGIRTSGLAEHRPQRRGHHRRTRRCRSRGTIQDRPKRRANGLGGRSGCYGRCNQPTLRPKRSIACPAPKTLPTLWCRIACEPNEARASGTDHFEYLMVWFESTPP
jgi:hypothetical protein